MLLLAAGKKETTPAAIQSSKGRPCHHIKACECCLFFLSRAYEIIMKKNITITIRSDVQKFNAVPKAID